jgi:hypothetical protein
MTLRDAVWSWKQVFEKLLNREASEKLNAILATIFCRTEGDYPMTDDSRLPKLIPVGAVEWALKYAPLVTPLQLLELVAIIAAALAVHPPQQGDRGPHNTAYATPWGDEPIISRADFGPSNEVKALVAAARQVAYGYPDELPDRSFDVDHDEMMALRAALVPFESLVSDA